jgi:integrase
MPSYRIGRLNGKFVIVFEQGGKRRRYRLRAKDKSGAEHEAPGIYAELTRPTGTTVGELWSAYLADRADRAIVSNMPHTWKALRPRFGAMPAGNITIEDCRAHTAERRKAGIKDGTIATELGRMRMVLRWSEKRGLLDRAPAIERPSPPKRKDRHLTREQCRALIDAATMPHVKLYIVLALATAARNSALLDLTWDRCDFDSGLIDLRNPEINRPHKGRAMVPMNRSLRAALLETKAGALSAYVIEWAGERVGSVKRGLKSAARAAGIREAVSPHLLRHSAAVHMVEGGIPMSEVSQFLGHENERITAQVYARFSPTYLRQAAAVLEYDDIAEQRRKA